ncbi:hypothetical protein Tco_1191239 [Tanacetum coccineum]
MMVLNWGEHTEEEVETNHALMAISTNNEVSLCSKTCIDSYYKLKTLCDEQTNQLGEQEAKILAYDQAVKKLEAQVVTFQKKQLSLNEQLTFQANELYEKDEKLKKYRRIGMKAVKEKEQLQKTVDSWKNSSKNLWKLVDSGMSSTSKVGLGYEIKSNDEIFKTDSYKGVPHPLTGDYTPKPLQELDESLYVYGKKGSQKPETSVSNDTFSENSVTTNEKVVSKPKPKEVEPSLQLIAVRKNVNSVRQNVNSVRSNVNTGSFNINLVKAKQPIHTSNSNSFSPGNWGTAVKTSAGYNWRHTRPNSNYNSGSNFVRTVNAKGPQGRPEPENT